MWFYFNLFTIACFLRKNDSLRIVNIIIFRTGRHFNIEDFQLIGRKLCDCVLEYAQICENPIAKSRAILEMTRSIAQQVSTW